MLENISIFDIVSVSLILILGIKGVINGFIKEVFGLVGIVGGVFLASRYAQDAGGLIESLFHHHFENQASLYLIGFITVLILFWLFSIISGLIVAKLLKMSGLGGIDKLLGFFVGSVKIFLLFAIFSVALSSISFIKNTTDKYMNKSFMYPIFTEVGRYIIKLDTNHIADKVISTKDNNSSKL
jgi:membrane protein required for colicin V production